MQSTLPDQLQLVAFKVGGEEFAVPVHMVQSIINYSEPTAVPGAEHHVRGLLNLRGKVISIVDLRRRFGLDDVDDPSSSRVLVVNLSDSTVGVMVDSVSEVLSLDGEELQEPPPEFSHGSSADVEGIIRLDERLIIVLDLEAALGSIAEPAEAAARS